MAGNSKKSRKPGAKRVRTFVSKGALPIIFRNDGESERVLKLMPHSDLAVLRDGGGKDEHWQTVTSRINWASTIASMVEFSFDPGPILNAGLDAMVALAARHKQSGAYIFKGEELKAVGDALTLADDMHDATTRRQHRDALVKLVAVCPESVGA